MQVIDETAEVLALAFSLSCTDNPSPRLDAAAAVLAQISPPSTLLPGVPHVVSAYGTPDQARRDPLHTRVTRYHPSAYEQLAKILTMLGKAVTGWDAAEVDS